MFWFLFVFKLNKKRVFVLINNTNNKIVLQNNFEAPGIIIGGFGNISDVRRRYVHVFTRDSLYLHVFIGAQEASYMGGS